jgi:hypothetical protein
MNKQRLEKLAAFLDTLPAKKFRYDVIVRTTETTPSLDCGTIACAMGWLPVVFPRSWKWEKNVFNDWELNRKTKNNYLLSSCDFTLTNVAKWFNITKDEAFMLFYPISMQNKLTDNARPKTVAKHIRKFINNDYSKDNK